MLGSGAGAASCFPIAPTQPGRRAVSLTRVGNADAPLAAICAHSLPSALVEVAFDGLTKAVTLLAQRPFPHARLVFLEESDRVGAIGACY